MLEQNDNCYGMVAIWLYLFTEWLPNIDNPTEQCSRGFWCPSIKTMLEAVRKQIYECRDDLLRIFHAFLLKMDTV